MGLSFQGADFAYAAAASRPNPFAPAQQVGVPQAKPLNFGKGLFSGSQGTETELEGMDLFEALCNPASPESRQRKRYIASGNYLGVLRMHIRAEMPRLTHKGPTWDLQVLQKMQALFSVLKQDNDIPALLQELMERINDDGVIATLPGEDKEDKLNAYLKDLQGLSNLNDPQTVRKFKNLLRHPTPLKIILKYLEKNQILAHNELVDMLLDEKEPWPLSRALWTAVKELSILMGSYPPTDETNLRTRRWVQGLDVEEDTGDLYPLSRLVLFA